VRLEDGEEEGDRLLSPERSEDRDTEGDLFENRSISIIQTTAFKAIDQLRDLPPREAENFADAFRQTSERLTEKQRALSLRRQEYPMELPDPLPKANIKEFPKTRKRAMTGAEAAKWRELEIRRGEKSGDPGCSR
jgi:hypothetical protein